MRNCFTMIVERDEKIHNNPSRKTIKKQINHISSTSVNHIFSADGFHTPYIIIFNGTCIHKINDQYSPQLFFKKCFFIL